MKKYIRLVSTDFHFECSFYRLNQIIIQSTKADFVGIKEKFDDMPKISGPQIFNTV